MKHVGCWEGRDCERAPILRLPHTRDLLCAYGGAGSTRAFNTFAKPLLRAPNWCARCEAGCRKQLPTWLSAEQIKANGRGWESGACARRRRHCLRREAAVSQCSVRASLLETDLMFH